MAVVHAFNPALGRQGQADLCNFKDSLVHGVRGQTRLHSKTLSQKSQTNSNKLGAGEIGDGPRVTNAHCYSMMTIIHFQAGSGTHTSKQIKFSLK